MNNGVYAAVITGCLLLCASLCAETKEGAAAVLEVTVSGVGVTVEAAEKNAIMSAVQQAVGLYVDGETLIKNEQVIHDQVLSASSGFVTSYKVTVKPHKRLNDGLFETTIVAMVQKGQVAEKLRSAKITVARVDASNLWAEAISRIKNASDAKEILLKYLPELPLKLLKAELVDATGRTGETAAPSETSIDTASGQVNCCWNIKIEFNTKAYYSEVAPRLEKLLDAIAVRYGEIINRDSPARPLSEGIFRLPYTGVPFRFTPESWPPQILFQQLRGMEQRLVLLNVGSDRLSQHQRFKPYVLSTEDYKALVTLSSSWLEDAAGGPLYRPLFVMKWSLLKGDGGVLEEEKLDLAKTMVDVSNKHELRAFPVGSPMALQFWRPTLFCVVGPEFEVQRYDFFYFSGGVGPERCIIFSDSIIVQHRAASTQMISSR